MSSANFKTGDLVWAKMKGHPQWPAQIVEPISNVKAPKNKKAQFVCFFGSKNYAWIIEEHMIPHSESVFDTLIQKRSKIYQCAIDELMLELESSSESMPLASSPKIKKKAESKKKIAKQKELKNDDFNGESCSKSSIEINDNSVNKKKRMDSDIDGKSSGKKAYKKKRIDNGKTSAASSSKSENLDREAGSSEDSNDLGYLTSSIDDVLENFKPQNIGFIGLDACGKVIVQKFLKSNFDLTLFNEEEEANKFVDLGAKLANSPAEIVVNCDITFCYLDSDIFKEILTSENGILKGFEEAKNLELGPKGCVGLNTIDYEISVEINEAISIKNGLYLEAPIWGTYEDVLGGKSIVFAAGDRKLFCYCKEYFNAISKIYTFVSCEIGECSKIGAILNCVNSSMCASFAEVAVFSERLGINCVDNVRTITSLFLSLLFNPGDHMEKMIEQTFLTLKPIKYQEKDMSFFKLLSDSVSQHMPISTQTTETYKRGTLNYAESDATAIYKVAKK